MLNKDRKHPIEIMLENRMTVAAPIRREIKSKLINFRINNELAENFKIYCKLHYTDISAELVSYITTKVEKSLVQIEEHKRKM